MALLAPRPLAAAPLLCIAVEAAIWTSASGFSDFSTASRQHGQGASTAGLEDSHDDGMLMAAVRSSSGFLQRRDHLSLLQRSNGQAQDTKVHAQKEHKPRTHPNTAICAAELVIDVGLPRSGTSSFNDWTGMLGYKTFHFLPAFYWRDNNYTHFWHDFRTHFPQGGVSFSDSPWAEDACIIADKRPSTFPEEKVKYIAVLRNASDWVQSLKTMRCGYNPYLNVKHCNDVVKNGKVGLDGGRYPPDSFMSFVHTMDRRWCHRLVKSNISTKHFCAMHEKGPEHEEDLRLAKLVIDKQIAKVEACAQKKNVLVVNLEDEDKEEKMTAFLGCNGSSMPSFPRPTADHVLLLEEEVALSGS